MGRKPDPEVQKKRKLAVELEQTKGWNARQIAEEMGVENVATVQRWLQLERGGKKPPFKMAIEQRLEKGESVKEIAAQLGCSEENVRVAIRRLRSDLDISQDGGERWVEQFLSDPEGKRNERFTRYESFGRKLVARCNDTVNTNPQSASEILALARGQFSLMLSVARSPEKIRAIGCELAQVEAISAGRERILERPELALEILHRGKNEDCQSCAADFLRRESIILRDLQRYPESLHCLEASRRLYRIMGHSGHDKKNNGLGSCALAESEIHFYMRSPAVTIAVVDKALGSIVTQEDKVLHFGLRFNKALALLEIASEECHEEADHMARALLREVGEDSTIPRLRTSFLAGRAAELRGDLERAREKYEDACHDAEYLQIPAAVGALLADIHRVSPDSHSLRNRILRIYDRAWASPIRQALHKALTQLQRTDLAEVISILRRESGGDKVLPLSASAALA